MSAACLPIDEDSVTPALSPRPRKSGAMRLRSGAAARSQFHSLRWLLMPWMASTGSVLDLIISTASRPPGTSTKVTSPGPCADAIARP